MLLGGEGTVASVGGGGGVLHWWCGGHLDGRFS